MKTKHFKITSSIEERQQTRRFFAEYFYFLDLEEISKIFFNRYGLNELQTEWSDDNRLSDKKKLLVYKMDCYCFEWLYETGLSHLEFFDPFQWLKSFTKIKSKTNARQNMKTTMNKKPRFLKPKKICFAWSQTISKIDPYSRRPGKPELKKPELEKPELEKTRVSVLWRHKLRILTS